MLWCQGAQNIGVFNHSAPMITHAHPRQSDERHGDSVMICSNEHVVQ